MVLPEVTSVKDKDSMTRGLIWIESDGVIRDKVQKRRCEVVRKCKF